MKLCVTSSARSRSRRSAGRSGFIAPSLGRYGRRIDPAQTGQVTVSARALRVPREPSTPAQVWGGEPREPPAPVREQLGPGADTAQGALSREVGVETED